MFRCSTILVMLAELNDVVVLHPPSSSCGGRDVADDSLLRQQRASPSSRRRRHDTAAAARATVYYTPAVTRHAWMVLVFSSAYSDNRDLLDCCSHAI